MNCNISFSTNFRNEFFFGCFKVYLSIFNHFYSNINKGGVIFLENEFSKLFINYCIFSNCFINKIDNNNGGAIYFYGYESYYQFICSSYCAGYIGQFCYNENLNNTFINYSNTFKCSPNETIGRTGSYFLKNNKIIINNYNATENKLEITGAIYYISRSNETLVLFVTGISCKGINSCEIIFGTNLYELNYGNKINNKGEELFRLSGNIKISNYYFLNNELIIFKPHPSLNYNLTLINSYSNDINFLNISGLIQSCLITNILTLKIQHFNCKLINSNKRIIYWKNLNYFFFFFLLN